MFGIHSTVISKWFDIQKHCHLDRSGQLYRPRSGETRSSSAIAPTASGFPPWLP